MNLRWESRKDRSQVLREIRSRAPLWPFGAITSGFIMGDGVVVHRAGLAGLLSPLFLGRITQRRHENVEVVGRFLAHPGAVLIELGALAYVIGVGGQQFLPRLVALLIVGIESYIRYKIAFARDREIISNMLSDVMEGAPARDK